MVTVKRIFATVDGGLRFAVCFAWTALWVTVALLGMAVTGRGSVALGLARRVWGPGILRIVGARLEVDGGADLDPARPHVFLMNHQSMVDIPAAFAALPADLRFIAKHELRWFPFIGQFMWATGMIFVDRKHRERAVRSLRLAGERIRAGASILAYPEGTRSRDGRIGPFKKGAFAVAGEAGVPIVPVAIEGARTSMPAGRLEFHPATVRVRIGAPIATAGVPREELMRQVRDALIELHRSIGGQGGDPDRVVAGVEAGGRRPRRMPAPKRASA